MVRVCKLIPLGWPCTLKEAPPGPFVTMENPELLCFKTEYARTGEDGKYLGREAYNSAGEAFHGKGDVHIIQPVEMVVTEEEPA